MSDKSNGGSAAIVEVDLGERSYPIHIADGLLDDPALLAGHVRGRQALVVTDTMVAPLYLARVLRSLGNHEIESLVIPSGEASKSVETLNGIFDKLLACRFNRAATIVALGGGVVGDVAGFAAACYQRGVPYVQVPTTLLAQVDSSVGGKTAVNHRLGKNMIGAFYQPVAVLADIGTLRTLGPRDLRAGIAEVIKYGILWDREFFDWIEENLDDLVAGQPAPLAFAVRRSCEIKAEIVNADEREADVRALLNLGHTFGHAIEAGMGYGAWLHGEAVAAGMCMAAATAMRIGWLSPSERDRIDALIARAGLPTRAPAALSAKRLLELMALDKKVVDGGIRLVLPRGIGTTVVSADYPMPALTDTLESCRG